MKLELHAPESCGSCGVGDCEFNVEKKFSAMAFGRHAWLLDEYSPEFNLYLQDSILDGQEVLLPWRNKFFEKTNYAWDIQKSCAVSATPLLTFQRSHAMRRLTQNGAQRQKILEEFDARYADAYAAKLPYSVTTLSVWQNFLPYLYLNKTLGGRAYDVLLSRAPRHVLHETLDAAKARYPESSTLKDFRSSPVLVEAEKAALAGARRIITPHVQLARLYPQKTTLLPWIAPKQTAKQNGKRIGFLGPTLGRRGAYLVRDTMQLLDMPLTVIGRNLEAENFWSGISIEERMFQNNWLDDIDVLLAPALTEFKPRLIMQALSRGVTVIATEACGLPLQDGLIFVDPYDANALAHRIGELFDIASPRAA